MLLWFHWIEILEKFATLSTGGLAERIGGNKISANSLPGFTWTAHFGRENSSLVFVSNPLKMQLKCSDRRRVGVGWGGGERRIMDVQQMKEKEEEEVEDAKNMVE